MVFDWVKAAQMIKALNANEASAGLDGNWEWTAGCIYQDGRPVLNATPFLASAFLTPKLLIAGELHECFVMEDDRPDWNEHTVWPPEALSEIGFTPMIAPPQRFRRTQR